MIKGIIFDLDGTLYRGESVVEGAVETVAVLEQSYQIFYLTNNSGRTRQQIIDKLNGFGFRADTQNTYCVSCAISSYLLEKKMMSVYLIGTDGLRSELESHNIRVKNSPRVSAVVVGFDQSFNYDKVSAALEAIDMGAKLIVANTDPSYPAGNNRKLPACGAMVGAIVGATGHVPDFHVGKPNTYMLELLCKEHRFLPEEICVVGDGPESDIKMAVNFQCQSILFDPNNVFSDSKISKVRDLREIITPLKKGGATDERT